MRSAGRRRSVTTRTTTIGSPSSSRHQVLPDPGCPNLPTGRTSSRGELTRPDAIDGVEPDSQLASSGTPLNGSNNGSTAGIEHYRQLAIAIRQRIETRLAGRVRDLAVLVRGNTIVLQGRCATYYSKQLAQHAALGVLDGESLDNSISVTM